MQVTSYRATPAQTKPECLDNFHCQTSTNENVTPGGIAVSQDLLRSGMVHYGDLVYIDGFGFRRINDCMASRHRNAFDLFVLTKAEEKRIGVRRLKVYLVPRPQRRDK